MATGKKKTEEKKTIMKRMTLAIFAALLTMASTSFAATNATNNNTVAPTLQVQVTVQKAVSLTLLTGTTAGILHCTVTPTGASPDYTMDFGNVDALGINNGSCNKFAPTTPGVSDAIYWSDYQLVPVYTSQNPSAGSTITAQVTTNFATTNLAIVRDTLNSSAVPAGVGDFSTMGVGSADTIGTAGVASGTALTRFIGVQVAPTNGAGMTGAQTATVTFTLTVQ